MLLPISYKKEITFYKCPKCNEEGLHEESIKRHIITKHEFPEIAKKVDYFCQQCTFNDEKEALEFVDLYQKYLAMEYSNGDINRVKLEWTKPSKYWAYCKTEEEGWYESTTINTITFKWIG